MNLQDLSKDALIEVSRIVFGKVGDTARTPKCDYVRMLTEHHHQDDVAQAVATVTANGVPMRTWGKPAAAADPLATLARLRDSLSALGIGAHVDEERVREIAREEAEQAAQGIAPREVVRIVREGRADVVLDEHMHPAFAEVLDACAAGLNVLLVGPAGCGKSHLAAQVAKALGREFGTLHCSAGASESQLTGWLLPTKEGGSFEFIESAFARMYGAGSGVFLLDEIDAADPNMLMVINGALANGHLHIPQRWQQPVIERGADLSIIAAANTYGTGADMLYVGRNQLDAATLDRFYVIPMDYDGTLEQSIADATNCAPLLQWVRDVRAKVAELRLRRVVSTRTLQKGAAMIQAGYSFAHVRSRMLAGWTRDELTKLGVLANA